jgi:hypothetical protein
MAEQVFVIHNEKNKHLEVCEGADKVLARIREVIPDLNPDSKMKAGKLIDGLTTMFSESSLPSVVFDGYTKKTPTKAAEYVSVRIFLGEKK